MINLSPEDFPFPVKFFHALTGHVYVKPVNNLSPFSDNQEKIIINLIELRGYGWVKNRVKANFTLEPIKIGYGFRIYSK